MAWNYERAKARIDKHLDNTPEVVGDVTSLQEHRKTTRTFAQEAKAKGKFPRSRAVVISGVHLYGQLLDFEDFIADITTSENKRLHTQMLELLDTHYRVWSSLVEEGGGFAVDFHGPRLHAVIAEADLTPHQQIERAIALAGKLSVAAGQIGSKLGVRARTRFGIDIGSCIALTTGRSHETDTLFLGRPANHAAKITASGNQEGIFLSIEAQKYTQTIPAFGEYGQAQVIEEVIAVAKGSHQFDGFDAAVARVLEQDYRPPSFRFHREMPPLSKLKFAKLKPSNTIFMGIASLFADIDGYTAYVDDAMRSGLRMTTAATSAIHVIREELNDVLKDDFGGKRTKFIGDCIQGMIAEGQQADDPNAAVESSLLCAAGMRSSFSLIQERLGDLGMIDLAIGIEYGPTSVTRIGNSGDSSIRCAAGRAVVNSERVQQRIHGGGIQLGSVAEKYAPHGAKRGFLDDGRIPEYDDAANLLGSVVAPAIQIIREDSLARPHLKAD